MIVIKFSRVSNSLEMFEMNADHQFRAILMQISEDEHCSKGIEDKRSGVLTHWGRVMHICVGNLTIIGSDNGLSPDQRQAITWTNARILLIGPLASGTNFSEIFI